jgi:hypothetical protein
VLLLTVYSWKSKAFASTKAAKDISDDADGLVGRYMVILVTIGHGLGVVLALCLVVAEACVPRRVKNCQPGG